MLLLTRGEIAGLLTVEDHLDAVERAFRLLGEGKAELPLPLHLRGVDGAFHAKAAALPLARRYAAIKVNGNFPANRERFDLPTVQGAILLLDAEKGGLLAMMDSVEVTLARTAAASALAARYLARSDSTVATICGCGAQASPQLEYVSRVLPIERVFAWDLVPARAAEFAARATDALDLDVSAVKELRTATLQSNVIITITPARSPFLGLDDVAPGTFIAAVGADNPEKQELEPSLLRAASVFADVFDQCVFMGEVHHAIRGGWMSREDVAGELADLVVGKKAGRTSAEEITIFDSTGTAVQDVTAAVMAYERALNCGAGREFALS